MPNWKRAQFGCTLDQGQNCDLEIVNNVHRDHLRSSFASLRCVESSTTRIKEATRNTKMVSLDLRLAEQRVQRHICSAGQLKRMIALGPGVTASFPSRTRSN